MLTLAKVQVYKKYGGDIDGLARARNPDDCALITDEEWFLIESLVHKLYLVKHGKASPDYSARIADELKQNVEGEEAIRALTEIA